MADTFERDRHIHLVIQRKYNLMAAWARAITTGMYPDKARRTALRRLAEAVRDYNEMREGWEGVFWMPSIPEKVGQLLSEMQ